MSGDAIHKTGKGAVGSVFAAYVSTTAPTEVQLAALKEAGEVAKVVAVNTACNPTIAGVGASGAVAVFIGEGKHLFVKLDMTVFISCLLQTEQKGLLTSWGEIYRQIVSRRLQGGLGYWRNFTTV